MSLTNRKKRYRIKVMDKVKVGDAELKIMNVYEVDIWRSVYHNEKFSHTVQRKQLIHAMNKEQAEKKITLEPEKLWGKEPLIIKTGSEIIYRLEKTGSVTIQPYYVYSDGRSPRPVK